VTIVVDNCDQSVHVMLVIAIGRKGQAIELYLKGIEELNKGIALDVSGQGDSFTGLHDLISLLFYYRISVNMIGKCEKLCMGNFRSLPR